MGKDYAASHKAHQAYQEEIERIQCSYNHAWAKLQDERDEARKKAWEIRKTALAEAGTGRADMLVAVTGDDEA